MRLCSKIRRDLAHNLTFGGRARVLGRAPLTRLDGVVLFFEILLVTAVVVITWFALYALYRLVTDES